MTALLFLIPAALFLGGLGLAAFIWAVRSGQFDDTHTPAMRILMDEESGSKSRTVCSRESKKP